MADETTAFELPSLRDIFYRSELTEQTTPEYDKLDKELKAAIKAACSTFEEQDPIPIECAAATLAVEAQVTGFEQGVAFAMQVLAGAPHRSFNCPAHLTREEAQQHE